MIPKLEETYNLPQSVTFDTEKGSFFSELDSR